MQAKTITVYAGFSPLNFITTVELPRGADPYAKETRQAVMTQVADELVYKGLLAIKKEHVLLRCSFKELGEPSSSIKQAAQKGTTFFYAYQFEDSQHRAVAPAERLLSETLLTEGEVEKRVQLAVAARIKVLEANQERVREGVAKQAVKDDVGKAKQEATASVSSERARRRRQKAKAALASTTKEGEGEGEATASCELAEEKTAEEVNAKIERGIEERQGEANARRLIELEHQIEELKHQLKCEREERKREEDTNAKAKLEREVEETKRQERAKAIKQLLAGWRSHARVSGHLTNEFNRALRQGEVVYHTLFPEERAQQATAIKDKRRHSSA